MKIAMGGINLWMLALVAEYAFALDSLSMKVHKNTYASGTVITSLVALNSKLCSLKCTINPDCGFANYDTSSGVCELLAPETTSPTLTTMANSLHLSISLEAAKTKLTGGLTIRVHVDNDFTAYVDGTAVGSGAGWEHLDTYTVTSTPAVLAVYGYNTAPGPAGIILSTDTGYFTDASWKCAQLSNPSDTTWTLPGFDDSSWPFATVIGNRGCAPWGLTDTLRLHHRAAKWIWTADTNQLHIGCRIRYNA